MWRLEDALAVTRAVETAVSAVGWHVALGGGVMIRGQSDHDLDLVAYPHNACESEFYELRRVLRGLGWVCRSEAPVTAEHWRTLGSTDTKHVEVWRTADGRRVDIIIPSMPGVEV